MNAAFAMASEGKAIQQPAAPAVRNLVTVSAAPVTAEGVAAILAMRGDGVAYSVDSLSPASSRDSSPLYKPSWFPSQLGPRERLPSAGAASGSLTAFQGKGSGMSGSVLCNKEEAAAMNCVCGGKRGDWREARFGAGWHDDCEREEPAPACTGRMCKVGKCAAGFTADCAAVCCCPLSVLHLLVLGCVKLPSIVVYKGYLGLKAKFRKRRRKTPGYEQEDALRPRSAIPIDLLSYSEPEPMSPKAGGFGDHAMWREFFGSDSSNSTSAVCSQRTD
eukprot:TRINITY_DN452_c0_g1_i1.p1 TRINITY_DN452_c0_g1~~TRINITY_DN452_c0_g1_i1.p1  ORF type:complete len:275 (-),score=27.53 TRINITY_DN452_c0_g1_i1:279-1103(-)